MSSRKSRGRGSSGGGGKSGAGKGSKEEKDEIAQALILADSFNHRFSPITLEIPRTLMPLVNVPMLDYCIEFLAAAGVEEIFVFSVVHADQICTHVKRVWSDQPNLSVRCVVSKDSQGPGDALRQMYQKDCITTDFLLVSGDVVSNMKLTQTLRAHKTRRRKESGAIMTSIFKKATPAHRTRAREDDSVVVIDPDTMQLLHYENNPQSLDPALSSVRRAFSDRDSVQFRYDLIDCHIDICAPLVLTLFTDNFDYQDLRQDFVSGVLTSEILHKVYITVIDGEYAARVRDLNTYAAVSKDIINRWVHPLVPDNNFLGTSTYGHHRGAIYLEQGSLVHRSTKLQRGTVIGRGSKIGSGSTVTGTVIGRNCTIGDNVTLIGCYLWDDVIVEDGSHIDTSILCCGVKVLRGSRIGQGCLLGFNVIVGPEARLPKEYRLTRVPPEVILPSPDELQGELGVKPPATIVGEKAVCLSWNVTKSAAKLPSNSLICSGADSSRFEDEESDSDSGSDMEEGNVLSTRQLFYREVKNTLARAVEENHSVDNVAVEIKSLRLAYDTATVECTAPLLPVLLEIPPTAKSATKVVPVIIKRLRKWKKLLQMFVQDDSDQTELIFFVQQYLEDEKSPILDKCFAKILHTLYDLDVIEEDGIFAWAEEQEGMTGDDTRFLRYAKPLLEWLRESEDDESSEEDSS